MKLVAEIREASQLDGTRRRQVVDEILQELSPTRTKSTPKNLRPAGCVAEW